MLPPAALPSLLHRGLWLTVCALAPLALPARDTFTVAETREDLQFLTAQIKTYEPALASYVPDFETRAAAIVDEVTRDCSPFEYFTFISRLAAAAEEGHFDLGDWSDIVHAGFVDDTFRYLPLSVKILGDRMYVWINSADQTDLQRGDEILAINGRPAAEIITTMLACLPADGDIPTYPRHLLSDGFPWMYYLYVEQPARFRIDYRRGDTGATQTSTVEALTRSGWLANHRARRPPPTEPAPEPGPEEVYTFELTAGTGRLTLKTFNRSTVDRHKVKAERLYADIFTQLQAGNATGLVVDLRDNHGGRNEFVDAFLPYIVPAAAKGVYRTSTSWHGSHRDYKLPRRHRRAFAGPIWVLVDGRTYSAAAELARHLREYAGATIVGEETGTRYEGFAAGSTESVVLPHSGIRIGIPRYHLKFPPSTKQPTNHRGLLPDIEVAPGIADLIAESDPAADRVRTLIAGR